MEPGEAGSAMKYKILGIALLRFSGEKKQQEQLTQMTRDLSCLLPR